MKRNLKYIIIAVFAFSSVSCEKTLNVTPNSEFSPGNVLTTEAGIRSLLFSAYAHEQTQQNSRYVINNSEVCTDMAYNTDGAENGQLINLINFTWNSNTGTFGADMWTPNYTSIRDANGVIENVDNVSASDAVKKLFKAEARVLRAFAYARLYSYFGPVPLRLSTQTGGDLARATDDEIKAFIETEITQSIADLPAPGAEETFGRMNKGIANGILAKFYLNTKQWQKAADACQAVIGYGYYTLYPNFRDMFKVANEANKEMLLVVPCRNEVNFGNWFMAGAMPVGYRSSSQFPDFTYKTTMSIFATNYRLRTAFVNTFAANDKRKELICTSFVNAAGATVNISGNDNPRSFKYFDNDAVGNNHGNDVPVIRYADILLTRAEALNEISGPTQAAQDLINQVRVRAGIGNLAAVDIVSKESFRTAIFRERGWEFVTEAKRREDLIRQGTFISGAQARGITNAQAFHVLFPIPQTEIDANKLCQQNTGY